MPRPRLPIATHLTPDEISRRYRACRDGLEEAHRHILRLLTRTQPPPSPAEVAPLVGMTPGLVLTCPRRCYQLLC